MRKKNLSCLVEKISLFVEVEAGKRMMFAYLNLCKRDASVIKAIAENSIVQYVLVHYRNTYIF